MLKRKGIQFHVCRNTDVKCLFVKRAHRTLQNKLYRYFTYKNTYRFVDVIQPFVKVSNNTIHTALGMAPAAWTGKHILEIWTRMKNRRPRMRIGRVKFKTGPHVRINNEKINSQWGRNRIMRTRYLES